MLPHLLQRARLPPAGLKAIARPSLLRHWPLVSQRRGFAYVADNALLQGGSAQLSRGQQMFWAVAGGAATFGLLSLVAKGFTAEPSSIPAGHAFPSDVRSRLMSTYGHLGVGLAATGAIAAGLFQTGFAHRLMRMNPWLVLGGSLVATIGSMIATQAIDYNTNPMLKHTAWMCFNAAVASSLCPLGVMGGALLYRAGLATGAIVGSLSAVAAVAPSDQFLSWGGGLSIGLGVVIAASLGQMFFPASSLLYNISLYGGLGVFSLFTLYDTQVILARCRSEGAEFDPINASFGVYLDTINIFIRMVTIMSGGGRRR